MKIDISFFIFLGMIPILSETLSDPAFQIMKATVLEGKSNDVDYLSDSFAYPPDARPFGKSYSEWIQQSWEKIYSLRCEDIVGFYQLIELDENVSMFMSELQDSELTLTFPKEKSLMLRMGAVAVTYPCPDNTFTPGPGQSLETFLHNRVDTIINIMNIHQLTLDGQELTKMQDFRFVSDIYTITGNIELASCFDNWITVEPQPCVTGGYYVIFKKMNPGKHTLQRGGEIPTLGLKWNQTIHFMVE